MEEVEGQGRLVVVRLVLHLKSETVLVVAELQSAGSVRFVRLGLAPRRRVGGLRAHRRLAWRVRVGRGVCPCSHSA